MELHGAGLEKGCARKRARGAIGAPRLALFETLGAGQNQMHVNDPLPMRAQQRAKARTHARGIEYDAAPFVQRPLETPVQLRKDLLPASSLLVRERKANVVGAQMQRLIRGGDTSCKRGFSGADRSGYREDETQDS